jgi:CO dehydrogenase maturation factor
MNGRIIAFSGKGGSGKTTVTALVLRQLIRMRRKPILAVDADPNASLGLTLGVEPGDTIADLRDRMGEAALNPTEISKERLMDQYLSELLREEVGFDLLTMGRPEGPKCYCYVNGLLRRYLSLLRKNYSHILVDCEAGMEYLSRLVVDDVAALAIVTQEAPMGLTTAKRIIELSESLPIRVDRRVLVLNQTLPDGAIPDSAGEIAADFPEMERTVRVPFDSDVSQRSIRGEPINEEAGKTARAAIEELTNCCLELSPAQNGQ